MARGGLGGGTSHVGEGIPGCEPAGCQQHSLAGDKKQTVGGTTTLGGLQFRA